MHFILISSLLDQTVETIVMKGYNRIPSPKNIRTFNAHTGTFQVYSKVQPERTRHVLKEHIPPQQQINPNFKRLTLTFDLSSPKSKRSSSGHRQHMHDPIFYRGLFHVMVKTCEVSSLYLKGIFRAESAQNLTPNLNLTNFWPKSIDHHCVLKGYGFSVRKPLFTDRRIDWHPCWNQ